MQKEAKKPILIYILSIGFLIQIGGQGAEVLLHGSSINGLLFLNFDLNDLWSTTIDQTLAIFSFISTILFIMTFRKDFLIGPLLWLFLLPLSKMILHSSFAYQLGPIAHFSRASMGLGLYWLIHKKINQAESLFKFGLSLTFIAHGIEALWQHPVFMDYLIEFFELYSPIKLSIQSIEVILIFIGILDIAIGITLLYFGHPLLYWWMGFWGFITAVERIVYHGTSGVTECLLRFPHWLVPLYFVVKYREKKKNKYLEAKEQTI